MLCEACGTTLPEMDTQEAVATFSESPVSGTIQGDLIMECTECGGHLEADIEVKNVDQ